LGLCWALGIAAIWFGRPLLGLWFIVPSTVVILGTASFPFINRAGRFGDLSYGLYIFAFPIQQTIIWLNQGRLSRAPLFLLTLFSCFLMAFASWHLVEKWALKLKPKRPASSPRLELESMNIAKAVSTAAKG
jgi:peptidoglycan/LPS O-acetylase OafA/YrhL